MIKKLKHCLKELIDNNNIIESFKKENKFL